MPKLKLTDVKIDSLPYQKEQVTYWDASLPAFGLRVGATRKTFIVITKGGRRRKVGVYPAISLRDARLQARQLLYFPKERPSQTLKDALDTYFQSHVRPSYKAKAAEEVEWLIERHAAHLFDRPIADIATTDVTAITDRMLKTPSQANHFFSAIRTFFNWCAARRIIDTSPIAHLSKPAKEMSRDRLLSDDEISKIWSAAQTFGFPYGTIIQTLILSGQRKGEIANLRRSWIQTDAIVFPSSIMKNGREHHLPLAPRLRSLLQEIPATSPFVFPARRDPSRPFTGFVNKYALDKLTGVTGWTHHDVRRYFATTHSKIGTPIQVTELLLSHSSGSLSGIVGVYNKHQYEDEKRAAMQRYDAYLTNIFASHSSEA